MYRVIALFVLAFVLSGCSTFNLKRSVSDEDLGRIKRVGVVSALGRDFHGVSIGTTIFNNTYFDGQVPEWNIDQYAATAALTQLQRNTRFESVDLNRSGLTIDQMRADHGRLLWEEAQKQGVDKLVLIHSGVSENYPLYKPAFGLFERSMLGLPAMRCIYAVYAVSVYDVSSRKEIAWEWGGESPCKVGHDKDVPFKNQFADYSSEEKSLMQQRLQARLDVSLQYALMQLSLLPGQ